MPHLISIVTYLLAGLSIACAVWWFGGLMRLIRSMRTYPTARHGPALLAARTERPSVCVIVPAHNEARIIADHVVSMLAQDYPALSMVYALDRCTDGTEDAIRAVAKNDPRVRIITVRQCPPDWAGKVNAMCAAVDDSPEARSADLLLFADADTILDPRCVSGAVGLLLDRGLDMLSLLSTLSAQRWFERIAQPVAGIEVMRHFPLSRVNSRDRRRCLANGQFMLFRSKVYFAFGGHSVVRSEVLEDIAFARVLHAAGHPIGVLLADGMLVCRMYDSWTAFRRGWKRIFGEALRLRTRRIIKAAFVVFTTFTLLPLASAAALIWALSGMSEMPGIPRAAHIAIAGSGLGAWLLCLFAAFRLARVPLWAVPLSPLGGLLIARILMETANDLRRGVPTTWAGRSYVRTPR